jgi:hypothetical protein
MAGHGVGAAFPPHRGADSLALPICPHGEDGQVVLGDTGRVVPVERCAERQEPGGHGLVTAASRALLSSGWPGASSPKGDGGVTQAVDVDPSVA